MNEPKPFASLSSGLLARKGQAKPAMRPQGFASFGAPGMGAIEDLGWNDMGHDRPHVAVALTPMDVEPVEAEVVPIHADYAPEIADVEEPVVLQQREEIERHFVSDEGEGQGFDKLSQDGCGDDPMAQTVRPELVEGPSFSPLLTKPAARAPAPRAAPGSKARAAFTLRLDAERHLQLRLASAVTRRSSQALVVAALDAFLAANPQFRELGRPS